MYGVLIWIWKTRSIFLQALGNLQLFLQLLCFKVILSIVFFYHSSRPCIPSCQHCWRPTLSPVKRRGRKRAQQRSARVVKVKQREEEEEKRGRKRTTCPLFLPQWQDWWRCTAAHCSSPGTPAFLLLSPLRPSATSSSLPTPPCSIPCWREVRVHWAERKWRE